MNVIVDTAARVVQRPLEALEHRTEAAHARLASGRDPDFIRQWVPTIDAALRYFAPEARHVERLPRTGPVLIVGNHSGLFYMPDMWVTALAALGHRGLQAPVFAMGYDLLFAIPGVESFLRRLGALPASGSEAERVLAAGAAVLVYPGGDWEASRPWTQRNKVDFNGHMGFVRLALRTGVPVLPVVAHGGHHTVVVLTRGERVAQMLGLHRVRVKIMPWLAGVPFGIAPVVLPPLPLPAKVTVDFLEPLDWSGDGPEAADDPTVVQAHYDEIVGVLQAGLDELRAERPYPLLSRLGPLGRPGFTAFRPSAPPHEVGDVDPGDVARGGQPADGT